MHSFGASTLLALGLTLPSVLGACPYAQMMGYDTDSITPQDLQTAHANLYPQIEKRDAIVGKKGVLFINRIAPGTSELYIADADGSNERPLLKNPVFEYHAAFSADGQWITFTSERNGDGNSDLFRVRTNGSGLEQIVATPSMEDSLVLSPDGKLGAFVSTANGYVANVWVMDVETGEQWNVTDTPATVSNKSLPHGYFRPSWSPDSQWLAFSSDRNSGWYGHGDPTFQGLSGWEHTQELSIYAIRPNGSDFRQVATKANYSLGSPQWSPDGKRIVYYEMTREATWGSHRPESIASTNSSIVSVDFETGKDRKVEVEGAGVKVFPQYVDQNTIGYYLKGGSNEGIYTTAGSFVNTTHNSSISYRSPSWSPDGKKIVYEKTTWTVRPLEKKLYSWDDDWEYRFIDVFPQMSNQNVMAYTEKQLGNSSVIRINPNGTNKRMVYNDMDSGLVDPAEVAQGLSGAFQPAWSTDGEWVAFGVGFWFQTRSTSGGWLVRATANGSYSEVLTESQEDLTTNTSAINSGFPSFSHDGKQIVYRVWGANSRDGDRSQLGLRILDLETRKITVLTTEWDNLPFFSPDGELIVFTRKTSDTNYDVCTVRPDGTDLKILTDSGANDAHAVWSHDGRIMYSTGMYGFQYECALYDQTFQPYGQVMIMDADGSNKRALTDSIWEDSMPLLVPNSRL
uniref:ARAD1A15312p n=1 Tax=Blastobotrys adeninivorans TaxID=409370 RepID=A0A060SXV3_BLAAD